MFSLKVNEELYLALPSESRTKEAFEIVMANYDYLREWSPWVNENLTLKSVQEYYQRTLIKFAKKEDEIGLNIIYKGKIAGGIGFHEINWQDKSAEMGYWLAKNLMGQGLVTKSVAKLLEYAFVEMELNRIVIKCVPENVKSRAIPERLGFTQEGIERDAGWLHTKFVDHVVYSILAKEWKTVNG